jgi:hypothetical protein
MSAKHWLLGLLVLLQVTWAAPQLARADAQQYVWLGLDALSAV